MKIDFIADTNFVVYVHEGNQIVADFLSFDFGISFLTEVELLGHKNISATDEATLKGLLSNCFIIEWNQKIKDQTILLRKNYGIKLPDAIIAATSLVYGIPLVTADKGFEKISNLDLVLIKV